MTGVDCMLHTAVDCGVEICFANPGTTELGVVALLRRWIGWRVFGRLRIFQHEVHSAA